MLPPAEFFWTLDTVMYLYDYNIYNTVYNSVQTVVDTITLSRRAWTVFWTLLWTIQLFSFLSFAGNKNDCVYCPHFCGVGA
jgi:hypothetical protein